jgi:predicted ATPase/DNA-binding winged helix-turn-helix (wHTH) protein
MAAHRQFSFGRFRFDARTGELWGNGIEAKLTPRASAVLSLLAERSQQLVTKQDLFEQVWDGMAVGDDALTSCIQELRHALGDDARRPDYIETLHRRGYRLMVSVTPVADPIATTPGWTPAPRLRLVGRDAEIGELSGCFERAISGHRQVVLVTGEPGIGKSSLAGAFLERIRTGRKIQIAHGQCLDHHGVGEPYLPLIEALTRLAGAADGGRVKEILATHAPSWLAQMPSLWTRSERGTLETRGRATRERMLRELTQAVEAIAAQAPLLLKLEDIHWSDASTLDWLAHVARRPEPARLMLLATLRPADAAAIKADLSGIVAELALHGHCQEISLNPLSLDAIETYLKARLGDRDGASQLHEIAPLLLERTGGNPLFMESIVNQLAQQDVLASTFGAIVTIPHDVRRFIERQIEDLDEGDRNLLTAASVIGREFATAAAGAALEASIETVELACARLARQGVFITKSGPGVWPDGTNTELYTFRHDLYRELLYDRLPASRRALSHGRVGRLLEAAWAKRPDAIAGELAEHFERGHEYARAIPHHQRAAAKALRRSANEEAINHLGLALQSIGNITDEIERIRIEVELRVALGATFMATRGFGAPEVLEAYARAEALCDRLGDRTDIFPALWGQWLFRNSRGELCDARRLCNRMLALAARSDSSALKLQAHHAMWSNSFACGELRACITHAEAGLALYDAKLHQASASSYGNHDALCCAHYYAAMALALAGDEKSSRAMIGRALAASKELNDPFSLAITLHFTSVAAQILGDVPLAAENSAASMRIATEHALASPKAWSAAVTGWCIAENGDVERGLALLNDATTALRAKQSLIFMPYLLGLLCDARIKARQYSEAMAAVQEGLTLAASTGEHVYSAELYRLHGELCARPCIGRSAKALVSFRTAIKLAKGQGARMLERRASRSLELRGGASCGHSL